MSLISWAKKVAISECDDFNSYLRGFPTGEMKFVRIIINFVFEEPKGMVRSDALVEGGLEHLVPLLLRHEWRQDCRDWELYVWLVC